MKSRAFWTTSICQDNSFSKKDNDQGVLSAILMIMESNSFAELVR